MRNESVLKTVDVARLRDDNSKLRMLLLKRTTYETEDACKTNGDEPGQPDGLVVGRLTTCGAYELSSADIVSWRHNYTKLLSRKGCSGPLYHVE